MAESSEPSSNSSIDTMWPVDASIENQPHERIVFENIVDLYVKGEDVAVQFTILCDVNVNEQEDQIGLISIGTTNMKKCLAYANVRFTSSSSGSIRHGEAKFPAADLPEKKDEFYQFCYLLNKTKSLGTSIPFQLNCEADDIDVLSSSPVAKAKGGSLIDLGVHEDGFVFYDTKGMLTEQKLRQENQGLLRTNHRLVTEKDELQTKFEVSEQRRREQIAKLKNEIQALDTARTDAEDKLVAHREAQDQLRGEFEACRTQCHEHQKTLAEQRERHRAFEETNGQNAAELVETRKHLAETSQLAKDQATQILDSERRLLQANELTESANQRNTLLERHIRDIRATSEKQQLSMQAKIDDFTRLIEQREDQIRALQETNQLCKEELNTMTLEREEFLEQSNQGKALVQRLQHELEDCRENSKKESSAFRQQMEKVREQLTDRAGSDVSLQQSMAELQRRCLKHQKAEVEAKRQLTGYQHIIKDLECQIHGLKERLATGAEEYRVLFRKLTVLEQTNSNSMEMKQEAPEQLPPITPAAAAAPTKDEGEDTQERNILDYVLNNSTDTKGNGEQRSISLPNGGSIVNIDVELQSCPMCNWVFPKNLTLEGKQQHVEQHLN